MAVTWSALSATQQADFAADKPLIGASAIPTNPSSAKWSTSGTVASTDNTDVDYPARRAYDGKPGLDTRSDGTSSTTWYFVLDAGQDFTFDAAAIINHNFDSSSVTSATLEVADSSDFATNLHTIATLSLRGTDKRIAEWSLKHTGSDPLRYTARYVRLKLVAGAAFTPRMGELLLLRRAQLSRKPHYPFDDVALFGDMETARTKGGVIAANIHARRRFRLQMTMQPTSDEHSEIVEWFRLVRATFVWLESPASSPNAWYVMVLDDLSLSIPKETFGDRPFSLSADEQGPETYYLDVEDNG